MNNEQLNAIVAEKYKNLFEFEAYPDYVNPFTSYMAGVFFYMEGDYQKSLTYMKETAGMVNSNVVRDDFLLVDSLASSIIKATENRYAWIIFDNGLGTVKKEWRIDLPIFVFTDKAPVVSVALPNLEFREQALSHIVVSNRDEELSTSPIVSMDRIVQTEFKKDFPLILTNAIVSSAFKAYLSTIATDKLGTYGTIGAGLYTAFTTQIDERGWTALPKEFQR